MLKCQSNSVRGFRLSRIPGWRIATTLALLALVFVSQTGLCADKKKITVAPGPKLGDQRQVAYFDTSKIVWPNPPAIARIRFLDLFTGEKVDSKMFDKSKSKAKQKWMDRLAGTEQTNEIQVNKLPFQLIRAYGVAVDSNGKIYTADQGVGAIFIFDPETKKVEMIRNGYEAHLGMINGLAMDDNDRLFVTDDKTRQVLVFDGNHKQQAAFGADVLVAPAGIAIDTENRFLYVVDTQSDVVDVFDADSFKLLRKLGKPGKKHTLTDPGTFSLPIGVAVDSEGNVYVTDTFNNRVEIFDADGAFIRTFGKNGDGPADFERPKGIAVDRDGHIWVVDSAQDRVKVFNQEGRLLIYFGAHGEYPGRFMEAYGIAIDKNNRVITTEQFPGRVQVFRYVTDAEAEAEKTKTAQAGSPAATKAKQAGAQDAKAASADQARAQDSAAK